MKKQDWLKVINPIMALALLSTVAGLLLSQNTSLPGMYEVHEWSGRLLILCAILHIYLNWTWIKINIFHIKS